jgi:hypothetical protein
MAPRAGLEPATIRLTVELHKASPKGIDSQPTSSSELDPRIGTV